MRALVVVFTLTGLALARPVSNDRLYMEEGPIPKPISLSSAQGHEVAPPLPQPALVEPVKTEDKLAQQPDQLKFSNQTMPGPQQAASEKPVESVKKEPASQQDAIGSVSNEEGEIIDEGEMIPFEQEPVQYGSPLLNDAMSAEAEPIPKKTPQAPPPDLVEPVVPKESIFSKAAWAVLMGIRDTGKFLLRAGHESGRWGLPMTGLGGTFGTVIGPAPVVPAFGPPIRLPPYTPPVGAGAGRVVGAYPRAGFSNVVRPVRPPPYTPPVRSGAGRVVGDYPRAGFSNAVRPIEPPVAPARPIEPPAVPVRPAEPPAVPMRPVEPPAVPVRPIEPPAAPGGTRLGVSGQASNSGVTRGGDANSRPLRRFRWFRDAWDRFWGGRRNTSRPPVRPNWEDRVNDALERWFGNRLEDVDPAAAPDLLGGDSVPHGDPAEANQLAEMREFINQAIVSSNVRQGGTPMSAEKAETQILSALNENANIQNADTAELQRLYQQTLDSILTRPLSEVLSTRPPPPPPYDPAMAVDGRLATGMSRPPSYENLAGGNAN